MGVASETTSDAARNRKILIGLLSVALLVRLLTACFIHPAIISDAGEYDSIGQSLATGHGFTFAGQPDSYRTPGYPFFLGVVYSLFESSHLAVRVLQGLFDFASCLLLYLIGKRLFNERIALTSLAIFALLPTQLLYVSEIMTETIFTTFLLLSVWLACLYTRTQKPILPALIGFVIGYATLIRPAVLLLPLVFLLFFHSDAKHVQFRNLAVVLALMSVCAALVIVPWMWRNYVTFDHFALTSNAGENLWIGHHEGANGTYNFSTNDNPLQSVADDFKRSDLGEKLAFQFVREHPLSEIPLTIKKIAFFFSADYWLVMTLDYHERWKTYPNAASIYGEFSLPLALSVLLPFCIVAMLAIFGLSFARGDDRVSITFVRNILLYWLMTEVLVFASPRFRVPVNGLFVLAAAYGIELGLTMAGSYTRSRKMGFALAVLVLIGGWSAELYTLHARQRPVNSVSTSVSLTE
jgi:4-amino-4-deoxy-L-arabinose transferase-like glycosyltransferase